TYGNAGYLREQMCKYICPYARFQSALIDKDSLIISYDAARGEPRGARSRKQVEAASKQADCIDCTLCVQVCPTGIDIRNGLQNECIACAACIDVCDSVMEKVGSPKGLIRYSTANGMALGWSRRQMFARVLRPRVLIYGAALTLGAGAFAASIALRSPFLVDVIRDRGTLARTVEQGEVENVYRVQIMNRTERAQRYRILAHGPVALSVLAPEVQVDAAGIRAVTVSLRMAPQDALNYPHQSVQISFEVKAVDQAVAQIEKSTFFVPD
ncbi:MAG: cytochrome c oxidase accessory protein CcoG, partial [Paucibacter sp.]|nr:cytochrome c oxidase accessory protein CcoG [Roseateles sp.]